jgi:hypothetical protein
VSRPATAPWPRIPAAVFVGLIALYVAFGLCLGNAPMQDFPDHLTRAHIIADLLFNRGAQFGDFFALKLSFSPYLAGDILLAGLDRWLGALWACRVWIAGLIALLPLSVSFALRRQGASALAASAAGVLALYVATDHFFVLGFTNYLLGVSCAFFTYGWFCTAARTGRASDFGWYTLLLLLSYAVHLTALIFVSVISVVSAALWVFRKEITARRAVALLLAPVVLVLFQLITAPALNLLGQDMYSSPGDIDLGAHAAHWWEVAVSKIFGFGFPAKRFNVVPDLVLFACVVAVALLPVLLTWRQAIRVAAEPLLIACVLAMLYVVMPPVVGGVFYADVRPQQYALLFLVIAGVRCAEVRPSVQLTQFALASLVALANLGYLATYLLPENAAMGRYQAVTAEIPSGATVLPIDTLPLNYYRPFLHAGAYATLNARALTPYLFAADIVPNMPYFVYRARPPGAPYESWYSKNTSVSWDRVTLEYQYVLVTVPWAARRIPVPYTVVTRNDVVALLRLHEKR